MCRSIDCHMTRDIVKTAMIGTARELEKRGEPINWEFIEAPIRTAEDVERDRELMRALNYGNKEILLKSGRNKNKNIVG